jgi:hypothetical protein
MTRGFKVLLPAGIRTSRQPEGCARPMLSWGFLRLSRAVPVLRRPGFPSHALLCFPCFVSERRNTRHSRALPKERVALTLAGKDHSLEVLHQDPFLGFSREQWVRPVLPDWKGASLRRLATRLRGVWPSPSEEDERTRANACPTALHP